MKFSKCKQLSVLREMGTSTGSFEDDFQVILRTLESWFVCKS